MSHYYLIHTKKQPQTLKITLRNGSDIELFAIVDKQLVGLFINYPKFLYKTDKKYFYYIDFEVDALLYEEMIEWILKELQIGNAVSWLNQWRVDCPKFPEAAEKEMELQNTIHTKEYVSLKEILQSYENKDYCENFNIEYEFIL